MEEVLLYAASLLLGRECPRAYTRLGEHTLQLGPGNDQSSADLLNLKSDDTLQKDNMW